MQYSVGSLGRYPNEGDVRGLVVRDSTMKGTMNGVRIKTWANSPGSSAATNMTFENIKMNNVSNPIIIDQAYCPFTSCPTKVSHYIHSIQIRFQSWRELMKVSLMVECSPHPG